MSATWVVATRELARGAEWETRGTVTEQPTVALAETLCRRGNVPVLRDSYFSEEGVEFRFLPVGGGEPVTFRARYVLEVDVAKAEDLDATALPSLDSVLDDY